MSEQTGYHYTFASNIGCQPGEVRVFETFRPYRVPKNLLTIERRRILKVLTGCENKKLTVKCVNVAEQSENECGSLCIALAHQFFFADQNVFDVIYDTRNTLYESFCTNNLQNFSTYPRHVKEKYLFKLTI